MKILFVNLPYHGHVNPTLGLVKELRKKGIEIGYVIAEEFRETVENAGAICIEYKSSPKLSTQMKHAKKAVEKVIDTYDYIIYEHLFFLGDVIAKKYNKKAIRLFSTFAYNTDILNELLHPKSMFYLFKKKWISYIWTKDVSKGYHLNTNHWLEEIAQYGPNLNIVYTIEDFQPKLEAFSKDKFKFVGPAINKDRITRQKLTSQSKNKKVFVSLGTISNNYLHFYLKIIEVFRNKDMEVIIAIGDKIKPETLGPLPNNVVIYEKVPQLDVLQQVDLFITHGGLNSVMEAMYFGVPMIVCPINNDQPINAKQVEKLGVGVSMDFYHMNEKQLEMTVEKILVNFDIKDNCEKMCEKLISTETTNLALNYVLDYFELY